MVKMYYNQFKFASHVLFAMFNFNKVNKDTESESLTLIYGTLLAITKILCGFRKMETTMLNNIRLNYAFSSTRDYNESHVTSSVRMGKQEVNS